MLKIRHNLNTTGKNKNQTMVIDHFGDNKDIYYLRGMFVELWNGMVRTAFCDV